MKKLLCGFIAAFGILLSIGAIAQVTSPPQVANVGTADLFLDVVRGSPSANSYYATAQQINGVLGYVKTVTLTAFSLAFGNSQTYYLIQPAGTLATGTFILSANPGDGQRNCVRSTQTQTAVTLAVAAGSGQTINGGITAMTANTSYCYLYSANNSTWDAI